MVALSDYYRSKGILDPFGPGAVPEGEYIDFPCSPLWQGYYYDRTLTPFKGIGQATGREANEVSDLRLEIIRLREAIERRPTREREARHMLAARMEQSRPKALAKMPPENKVQIKGIEV